MSTDYDYDKEIGQTGKRLSLKLKDSEKDFVFSLELINETHLDIYDKIKRINPDCKILNIGTFEYE